MVLDLEMLYMRQAKHFSGLLPAEEDGAVATPQAFATLGKKLQA